MPSDARLGGSKNTQWSGSTAEMASVRRWYMAVSCSRSTRSAAVNRSSPGSDLAERLVHEVVPEQRRVVLHPLDHVQPGVDLGLAQVGVLVEVLGNAAWTAGCR